MSEILVRSTCVEDMDWVKDFIHERWGSEVVVVHGEVYSPHQLPGFIAILNEKIAGLITYQVEDKDCEIVTLDSIQPSVGVGTALMDEVARAALRADCRRLWLITTNDNLDALRFYQKRGYELVTIHRNAVTRSRKIKPEIPMLGAFGIPLRDEIELEKMLTNR